MLLSLTDELLSVLQESLVQGVHYAQISKVTTSYGNLSAIRVSHGGKKEKLYELAK